MTHSPQGLRFWSGNWRQHCGAFPSLGGGRCAMVGLTLWMLATVLGCEPATTEKDVKSDEPIAGSESNQAESNQAESNAGAISESANQPPEPPKAPVPEAAPVPADSETSEKSTATVDSAVEGDTTAKVEADEKPAASDGQGETKNAASDPQVATPPRTPANRFLPPNRNPRAAASGAKTDKETVEDRKAREAAKKRGEITFDDLKFDMEKGAIFKNDMLGTANWELHEKVWKIRGFILPTTLFSQTGITEFVLVRDNQECCFGPGAALYDCIIVKMAPGKTINYTTRVVSVKGKLEIDTESFQYPDDGGHYAVYKMTAEEVK